MSKCVGGNMGVSGELVEVLCLGGEGGKEVIGGNRGGKMEEGCLEV